MAGEGFAALLRDAVYAAGRVDDTCTYTNAASATAVAVTTFLTQSRISWRSAASRNPASIAASSDSVNRSTYSVAPQG
jgi:hypothetical protein